MRSKPTPFEEVFALVRRVPRGKVITFGRLSRLVNGRLSALAVSWAMRAARRREKSDVPWQRVVNADGSLAHADDAGRAQRTRLTRERVAVDPSGVVDLARHEWTPRARK